MTQAFNNGHVRLYKNHGPTVGYWEGSTDLDGLITMYHSKKLDGKPVPSIYQAKAKNVGRINETTPYQQALSELASRKKKKMDKGYVEKVEDASEGPTNALGLPIPMKATPIKDIKPSQIDWSAAWIQPKLDGHRAMWVDGQLYSYSGQLINLPHIIKDIGVMGLQDVPLDGEIYIHGESLQDIGRLIKKHRPESLNLKFHVYDSPVDSPFIQRARAIRTAITNWDVASIEMVGTFPVLDMAAAEAKHAQFRSQGYEGSILRFGDSHYEFNKRSRKVAKFKDFCDAEFKIIDVREGKDTIRGRIGYKVPVWVMETSEGKTFTVLAQGNMTEKDLLWQNRANHVGKMLTVKYHYLSKEGIPQLPVALRFREDI